MSSSAKMVIGIVALVLAVIVNMLTVSSIALIGRNCLASEAMP